MPLSPVFWCRDFYTCKKGLVMKTLLTYLFVILFSSILSANTGNSCTDAIDLDTPPNNSITIKDDIEIKKNSSNKGYRWYKFTAPQNPNGGDFVGIQINYLNRDNKNYKVDMSIREGTCKSLSTLQTQKRGGKYANHHINQNLYYSFLEPGHDYYIRFFANTKKKTKMQMSLRFYDTINRSNTFKTQHRKDFTNPLYQKNLTGDIVAIGNSNYCTDFDRNGQCDLQGNNSLTAGNQAGNVIPIIKETTIDIKTQGHLPSDLDSNVTYNNQSKATLTLPQNATIKWAGLFWAGTIEDSSNLSKEPNGKLDERREAARKVVFKRPDGTIKTLSAAINNSFENDQTNPFKSDFRWLYYHVSNDGTEKDVGNTEIDTQATYYKNYSDYKKNISKSINLYSWNHKDAFLYQGFVNVTEFLQDNNNGTASGEYTVSNITSDTGHLIPVGVLGAWQLLVVYEDIDADFRNIAVTDGLAALYDGHNQDAIAYAKLNNDPLLEDAISENTLSNGAEAPSIGFYHREIKFDINGFYTPKAPNTVNSTLTIFLVDGEGGSTDAETLEITQGGTESDGGTYVDIDNGPGWNGAITNKDGTDFLNRSPDLVPVLAVDIRNFPAELANEQSATTIRMRIKDDRLLMGVVGFSTDLRKPKLCYDYAYSQYNQYFTEDYNATSGPRIQGNVSSNEPVKVKLYIKNQEATLSAEDMYISILDINETQATYDSDSVLVVPPSSIYSVEVDDSSLDIASDKSYVKNIPIANEAGVLQDLESFDHTYIYYSLNPLKTSLDMPIHVKVDYNVTIPISSTEDFSIDYHVFLNDKIKMCTENSTYSPAKGIFNIIHNNYYDTSQGIGYYNLPTQVTAREGNFQIISMDPDNLDNLQETSTIVGVEMIDASAFHDINASCEELSNAISPRVWIMLHDDANDANTTSAPFDKNAIDAAIAEGMTTLTKSSDFYKIAKKNAAFRLSYNLTSDGNQNLVKVKNGSKPNTYKINFTELVQNLHECSQDMDNNTNNTDTVAKYCGNNSDKLTKKDIATCMKCVYGFNTRLVCSRDNFTIKPEAIMLNINDTNETNGSSEVNLTSNNSGSVGATAPILNLAAGYKYNIEINASNHVDNNSSYGYTRSFSHSSSDTAEYTWQPRTTLMTNACNDENNQSLEVYFLNGSADIESNVDQVGDYRLNITDKTWTAVDSDTRYMTHHSNSYYLHDAAGNIALDCKQNSSITQLVSSQNLNGCEISSNHTNPENSYVYNDYNITFHPYKFNTSSSLTLGLGNSGQGISPNGSKPYVYMANIDSDENMSIHLNTTATAQGKNGGALSNFVSGCFAKPIRFEIGKTATRSTTLTYKYRHHDLNSTSSIINGLDISGNIPAGQVTKSPVISIPATYFQKDQLGTVTMLTNLNYNRDVNITANPEDINITTLKVDDNNTFFHANLSATKTAEGNTTLNQRVLHYYGRTVAPKITVVCNTNTCRTGLSSTNNNNIRELISYVIYCKNVSGTVCSNNPTLGNLPDGATQVADVRWFENRNHDRLTSSTWLPEGTDGTIGVISETPNTGRISEISRSIVNDKYTNEAIIEYSGPLPYDATLQMQSSRWLIYNENNTSATTNQFIIQFTGDGGWSGKHEDNTTTKTNAASTTNRRIMW
jgi:hypothetical protein